MRKFLFAGMGVAAAVVLQAGQALACGGLVAPDGDVRLAKATTFVAWSGGVEHYVTSFAFTGAVSRRRMDRAAAGDSDLDHRGGRMDPAAARARIRAASGRRCFELAAAAGSCSGGRRRAGAGRGTRRHRPQGEWSGGHRLVHPQRVPRLAGDPESPAPLRVVEPHLHGGEIQHVARARSVTSRPATACRCSSPCTRRSCGSRSRSSRTRVAGERRPLPAHRPAAAHRQRPAASPRRGRRQHDRQRTRLHGRRRGADEREPAPRSLESTGTCRGCRRTAT